MNRTLSTTPVILNLFQDPSCSHDRSYRSGRNLTNWWCSVSPDRTVRAEKWALKQVQGDDQGRGSLIL